MATSKTALKKAAKPVAKKAPAKSAPPKKAPGKEAPAGKTVAKPVAKKAVPQANTVPREATVDMGLAIRGSIQPEAAGTRAKDMSASDRQTTLSWFAETRGLLNDRITDVEAEIVITSSGPRKDGLLKIKGSLLSDRQILDRREEAFFADSGHQTMRAPTQPEIDKTRGLAAELGDAIAKQKEIAAIVKLVNDMSGLVLNVSNLG
jgi:hypothetical protein